MVSFRLTPEQEALRQSARAFAKEVIAGSSDIYSKFTTQEDRFRSTRPMISKAAARGQIKALVPKALGGYGGSSLDTAIALEEMYAIDPSVTLTIVGTGLGLTPLILSGKEELQKKYLAPFLKEEGAPLAGLMHSEPGGTANWLEKGGKGLQCVAKKEGEFWVVNGQKLWTTNSGGWDWKGADLGCLVCRIVDGPDNAQDPTSDPKDNIIIFLLTRDLIASNPEGSYVIHSEPELLGHPAVSGPHTEFTNFKVPVSAVLQSGTAAADLIVTSFTPTAALVGVMGTAIARTAFEAALAFAKKDDRSGSVPIIQRPTVADMLTNIKIRIDTSRLICWKGLDCLDNGPGELITRQEACYQAKIYATDACVDCVTDAMKVVGMLSYRKDYPFGKLLNDAMCMPLFDGGNIGIRRRQLEKILQMPDYYPWAATYPESSTKALANGNGHA